MKKWIRPRMTTLSSKQLAAYTRAHADSLYCEIGHLR